MAWQAQRPAPGAPGIPARWTSSAKTGVGTAPAVRSSVWFTLSHGILNEIYYPRVDYACTRDFGLIVTNGTDYFAEEKRDTRSAVHQIAGGVPAFALVNTAIDGRFRIEKTVLGDPRREVVLQRIRFVPMDGRLEDYRLYALLAPHLVNRGAHNTAWLDDFKGAPMLFARGRGHALALASSAPYRARSVGYVGFSDGWQDLSRHFTLTWAYDEARDGNVALAAEIDLRACGGELVLALGFGRRSAEAAHRATRSLKDGFDSAVEEYVDGWRAWHRELLPLDPADAADGHNTYRIGAAVLRCHEASSFPGGLIASLSIPWGFNKGDEDLGGYHLVWPRDLAESAGALVACGAMDDARRVVRWFEATQEADGHWPQNCWLDGTAYWTGVQMDECAFPVLLVDLLWREAGLGEHDLRRFWPMVRRAITFVVQNGPVTGQDRWEEDGGFAPFSLAVAISALLAAADLADHLGDPGAAYLRETADLWNDRIESWLYVTNTPLAHSLGIDGYYMRIAPPDMADGPSPADGFVPIKNRPPDQTCVRAGAVVSPDALALVRFGLRAPDDPRIRSTLAAVDALLKVELPAGPCWRRYNGDGYGEHEDGAPFDGTGLGRPWPLLTGERAHYELAAGNRAGAEALLRAFEGFASDGHLLPEQVWDAEDIPERELVRGRPSGSAMPLVWAHAEHIKLLRSLRDGRVFDMPPQSRRRYQQEGVRSPYTFWRTNCKSRRLPAGRRLRIELRAPAVAHWSTDAWQSVHDAPTRESGFGTHVVDLDTGDVPAGGAVVFTLYWLNEARWEGVDYWLRVG
jgi:glucoamylase